MGSPYVREAVEDWLAYIATERQLAAKTSEAYERDVSQFLAFLASHLNRLPDMKQLLALQARDVRAFLAARRSEGVGSRSLARTLSALRMFYKFLERRGYGKNDAIRAVALPKLPHSVPKPLTAPKATALVDGTDIGSPDQPEWISARDTAVLALLYGSGLRISEALSLKRKDAPIKGRDMLRVHGKGGKTRVVPVLPIAREAVELYLKLCPMRLGSDDPLFVGADGKQLSPASSSSRSRAPAPRSACPTRRRRMRSATPSPRICSAPAPISAPSRSCSATPASRPRRAIPRSTASICSRPTDAPTPALAAQTGDPGTLSFPRISYPPRQLPIAVLTGQSLYCNRRAR